jgi:hypothetical protein
MNQSTPQAFDSDRIKRYQELRHKILDRTADERERAEIEEIVLSAPELKSDFVEFLHQEASLLIRCDINSNLTLTTASSLVPNEEKAASGHLHSILGTTALAAAILIAVTMGTAYYFFGQPRSVLTIVSAKNCQWGLTTSATTPGRPLPPGRFILNSGIAVMKLPLVDLTIEGPTDIEVISAKRCMVRSGKVFANVHPGGEGFVVETPTSVLTDRGTVFAVNVSLRGDSDLTVVKGIVDAEHRSTGESRSVGIKGGLRLTSKGVESIHESAESGPMESGVMEAVVPSNSERQMQISTAVGSGKDAYVIAGQEKPHTRSEGMLLAKITPDNDWLRPWRRRAYLHFDLSLVSDFTVEEASLQLRGLSTNIGYLSQTPDTWFAVYGLTDESEEDWAEESITWANCPGVLPNRTTLDPQKTTLLGRFMVFSSDVTSVFKIEGDALLEFLSKDTNGGATLILVAETMGKNECWAHGFASRRHPDLPPPTLRLTLEPKESPGE